MPSDLPPNQGIPAEGTIATVPSYNCEGSDSITQQYFWPEQRSANTINIGEGSSASFASCSLSK